MTRSMTAYGRAMSKEMQPVSWIVEIHSVNRKGLDIHMHLAKELLFLDIPLRKEVASAVQRGQITIKVAFKKSKDQAALTTNLKKLKTYWQKCAQQLDYPIDAIDLPFLLAQMESVPLEEIGLTEEKIETDLKKTLKEAMDSFLKMKEVEGVSLAIDIKKRLKLLAEYLKEVEQETQGAAKKYREKLLLRLEEVAGGSIDDERILKEVALYAEKIDITEEITRLKSHFEQAESLFSSKEKSIGRTLDFLTQEMLREINTIASKSGDLSVTKRAVLSKAELEKIREQVQNIE